MKDLKTLDIHIQFYSIDVINAAAPVILLPLWQTEMP